MFDLQKLVSGPLTFIYPISASVSIVTAVTGDARQYATVSIVNGALTLWSTTLTQLAPVATIPYDIIAGEITIDKGGTFTLTVPTTLQNGNVAASLMIKSGTQTVPFQATVASWPLSS